MKYSEKQKIIQKAFSYLKTAPSGKKRRRKSFLKIRQLGDRKVFFDIFIPKILKNTINDQYRRLKDLPEVLEITLQQKPQINGNRYIFSYNCFRAVVEEKVKQRNRKQHSELYLLTFFKQ